MIHVGYLSPHSLSSLPREEKAAWEWLEQSPMTATFLPFRDLLRYPRLLEPCQILWWHSTGTLTPASLNSIQALKSFSQKGGGILLTLMAASFVHELGLEPIPPDRIVTGKWKEETGMEGYPDIRGFHGFLNHPLFDGLHGGVYTWMPAVSEPYCEAVYSRELNPRNGRVLAVEWGRISFNENRKCVVEFRTRKGTILTVGTHLYFAPLIDEFARHREAFLLNTFRYLIHPGRPAPCFFPKSPKNAFPE